MKGRIEKKRRGASPWSGWGPLLSVSPFALFSYFLPISSVNCHMKVNNAKKNNINYNKVYKKGEKRQRQIGSEKFPCQRKTDPAFE